MIHALSILFEPLGVTVDIYVLIMVICASFITSAKDIRLGLMFLFLFGGGDVILWYSVGYSIRVHVVLLFTAFVLLTLSLMMTDNKRGAII